LTIQTATALPRHPPKAARAHPPLTHQLRDTFGFAPDVKSKSCDRIWCYEN
jgi:hypothetical protein